VRRSPGVIKRARGFTYIGMLAAVSIMGVFMMATGEVWQSVQRHEKERELLFIGNEYRRAISEYYRHTPGNAPRYVLKLENLLKDARYPVTRRYLRKLYKDPLTGKDEWGLLKNPAGQIYGVYSLFEGEPYKKSNFKKEDKDFEDKTRYADWVFKYAPVQAAQMSTMATVPAVAESPVTPFAAPKKNAISKPVNSFSNSNSFSNTPKTPIRR